MKKLFGRAGGSSSAAAAKKDGAGPLTNKTVQVGPHTVLVEHVLGLGGYGEIYRAVDISSGQRFALKHLRLDRDNIGEVQREAKTMAKLRGHPNILRLHAVAFAGPKGSETDGFFLLDYCPGTLLDLMGRHKYMLETHTIIHIFSSVCHAVAAMHHQKPPMAHRDLKAENVLMLPDGTWVVCDFGSATSRAQLYDTPAEIAEEEDVIAKHTTPAYRPPEMWDLQLMRTRIDTKVDVWALGVLLYVLCFGRLPFAGDSKLAIINARYDLPRPGTHNRPQQLVDLMQGLMQADPAARPTIDELLGQLDGVARSVMGRGILQPSAADRVVAAGGGLRAEGSFSGLAAAGSGRAAQEQEQQQYQQQQQQQAELRAVQQQEFLREQQLRQYQQQQEQSMAQQRQAQQERLQQLHLQQQQEQQQQGGSRGGIRGGGSFWNQSEASDSPTAAGGGVQRQAAAGSRGPAGVPQEQQPSDWAHFSSPEQQSPAGSARQRPHAQFSSSASGSSSALTAAAAAAAAAGGAASVRSVGSSSAGGRRAPPSPPGAGGPQLSSAGQGLRAHAVAVPTSPLATSPLPSPRGVSLAGSPPEGGPVGGANPFAAERSTSGGLSERSGSGGLHMRWQPPAGQQQQQWHDGEEGDELGDAKLSQLKDIKSRAAAAAAALTAARVPASARHIDAGSSGSLGGSLGSLSDQHSLGGVDRAALERQPRPYSMSSTSSRAVAARQQQQQQSWRSAPGTAAGIAEAASPGNVNSPISPAARSARSQYSENNHTAQDQQQPSPRSLPRASSLRVASVRSEASGHSDRSGGAVPAAVPAVAVSAAALAPRPAAGVDTSQFATVRDEVQELRQEVAVLTQQNQAFVYRIKQLEEFTVSQTAAMRKLQLAVDALELEQRVGGVRGMSPRVSANANEMW